MPSLHKRIEHDCTWWLEHLIFPLHHMVLLIKNNGLFVASNAYASSLSDILVDINQIKTYQYSSVSEKRDL